MSLPKIIIKHSRLLDPICIFYCQNNPDLAKGGWNKWIPPSEEELDKRIDNYKKARIEIEDEVLLAMLKFWD